MHYGFSRHANMRYSKSKKITKYIKNQRPHIFNIANNLTLQITVLIQHSSFVKKSTFPYVSGFVLCHTRNHIQALN